MLLIPISRYFCFISGFTETREHKTGTEWNYLASREAAAPQGPGTMIEYWPWDQDWEALAIYLNRVLDPKAEIYLFGYSWGVGHGCVQLAHELMKLGRKVKLIISCDGVYHPNSAIGRSLALTPWPKIVLPPNVEELQWFYQRNDKRLRGHEFEKAKNATTIIQPGVNLEHCIHGTADESPEYLEACLKVVRGV